MEKRKNGYTIDDRRDCFFLLATAFTLDILFFFFWSSFLVLFSSLLVFCVAVGRSPILVAFLHILQNSFEIFTRSNDIDIFIVIWVRRCRRRCWRCGRCRCCCRSCCSGCCSCRHSGEWVRRQWIEWQSSVFRFVQECAEEQTVYNRYRLQADQHF